MGAHGTFVNLKFKFMKVALTPTPRKMQIIYPVILNIEEKIKSFHGKDRVTAMSNQARNALEISSELTGLSITSTPKDHRGAPLPENGVYWSISHKPKYAAAVCSNIPVGIDIEKIRPRGSALLNYIAKSDEWNHFNEKSWFNFFRIFTSKEAVLKLTGDGISRLGKCKIHKVINNDQLVILFENKEYIIEHFLISDHIASITNSGKYKISWNAQDTI